MEYINTKVLSNTSIAENTHHIVLETAEKFDFLPGQFVRIYRMSPEGKMADRAYSIANIHTGNQVEIAVSAVAGGGFMSDYLLQLKKDDMVQITGPFGRFLLAETAFQRYFFLATGTGITPYRSILRQLAERPSQPETWLCLGVRTQKNSLYVDDFLAFAAKHPWFHFFLYYSRDKASQPHESEGYVQDIFKTHPPVQGDVVYLCGNPFMVDENNNALRSQGFTDIVFEKYVFKKKVTTP